MVKSLIIADDFTGANDIGVQLARRGYQTEVFLRVPETVGENMSVVIDTESRGLGAREAYEKVKKEIAGVDFEQFSYVMKKVDSTLRGNIAWEIKAVDEDYQSELIIFMPALPDLKRTTVNGVHMLNGIPITQTEIARDPKKPVLQDNIRKMLQEVYDENVIHISLEEIEAGKIDFASGRVFTADAETNRHMQEVITSAVQTKKKVLYVGTSAISDNIMELEAPSLPAIGLLASVSEVTNEQIKYAEKQGMHLIQVSLPELLDQKFSYAGYVEETVKYLKSGKDVLVLSTASYDRSELTRTINVGKTKGMTGAETSAWAQSVMGNIGKEILEQVKVAGVFLAGGDTAISLFDTLDASGSEIIGEIAMGIPIMRLKSGKMEGLKVITKAGAFGNLDAIVFGMRKLKE